MRAWGRVYNEDGSYTWQASETDPVTGDNTWVYITNLIQVLKLVLGESPFFSDWGIPAINSVLQQIAPDLYVQITQQRFAPFFAALSISRITTATQPTYRIVATSFSGANFSVIVQGNQVPG